MSETILVINAGSSSLKFQLFAIRGENGLEQTLKGQLEGVGVRPRFIATGADGGRICERTWQPDEVADATAAMSKVVQFLRSELKGRLPIAIGHRVVHGGPEFSTATVVTDRILDRLLRLSPLAPLHQPNNLYPIRAIARQLPGLLQVACFDTAFHRSHPEVADHFAIPLAMHSEGVRRYGFHGLSYEYIAGRLGKAAPEIAGGRVAIAHLGSGASMCAIVGGRSIDSTMGFTALDGLPMGTRPGQIDPGVVLYLIKEKGMSPDEVETFLYHDCGLKGLSGVSNDVRELLASPDPKAKFAIDYFVQRVTLCSGMIAAAMGGIDGFVFTAGIGENSPQIRAAVLKRLDWLGIEIDDASNSGNGPLISSAASRVRCYVIPTDEELMIATHTLAIVRGSAQRSA